MSFASLARVKAAVVNSQFKRKRLCKQLKGVKMLEGLIKLILENVRDRGRRGWGHANGESRDH